MKRGSCCPSMDQFERFENICNKVSLITCSRLDAYLVTALIGDGKPELIFVHERMCSVVVYFSRFTSVSLVCDLNLSV